jgi:hypothetical protein
LLNNPQIWYLHPYFKKWVLDYCYSKHISVYWTDPEFGISA